MGVAERMEIPEELQILNRNLKPSVIVIGDSAYKMVAMAEGQLEQIIADIAIVQEKIDCPHGKCPKCEKVVINARMKKIYQCPDDQTDLITMNQSLEEALLKSSKIPDWVQIITGIPSDKIREEMTFNQMRHFAGEFWKINFSDEGMPKGSLENFQKLLEMTGAAPKKKPEDPQESKEKREAPTVES